MAYMVYAAVAIWTYGAKTEPVKSDAAIVLGAAVWGDKPSPVFQGRIDHALWLYKHQYVDKLIFTGDGDRTLSRRNPRLPGITRLPGEFRKQTF